MKKNNIGKYVQDARKEKGITQEQLAEMTGISWSAISRFETGRTMLSVEKILRILEALDIGAEEIFIDYIHVYPNVEDDVSKEILGMLSICTEDEKKYALENLKLILKYLRKWSD